MIILVQVQPSAVAIIMLHDQATLENKSQRDEFDWHLGRILNLVVTSVLQISGRSMATKMDYFFSPLLLLLCTQLAVSFC